MHQHTCVPSRQMVVAAVSRQCSCDRTDLEPLLLWVTSAHLQSLGRLLLDQLRTRIWHVLLLQWGLISVFGQGSQIGVSACSGCYNGSHRLRGLDNRKCLSSGGWNSEIKVSSGMDSSEASPWLGDSCLHCVSVSYPPFVRTPVRLDYDPPP